MSLHAAYMLIPRNLTRLSRNPKHVSSRVRSPPRQTWRSERIRREAEWECQAAQLGTLAEGCLAGEVRKCLATDRTVRRGKAVGKNAILNGCPPFLLALAQFTPSR